MSFFELKKIKIDKLIEYKNIGAQTIQALKQHHINNILDLLFYYPNTFQQVSLSTFKTAQHEQTIAVYGEIVKVSRTRNAKIKYTVEFKDTDNTIIKLLFTNHMPLSFKSGQKMIIMGKYSNKTCVHPKIFYSTPNQWQSEQFHYNVKLPLSDYRMQQCIKAAMQYLNIHDIQYTNTHDIQYLKNISSETALNKCLQILNPAHKHITTWRLFFENLHGLHGAIAYQNNVNVIPYLEAIAWHLSALNTQNHTQKQQHYTYHTIAYKYQDLYHHLISTLTDCQTNTLIDIQTDLQQGDSRHRMIFGDVCTGKTRIAILTSMYALSHNRQVLFLAPTTMLAKQHYETFLKTFNSEQFGSLAKIMLHTKKADISQADIIIGTHSLLHMPDISNVGLIIIDEQHKFGVLQRHSLISKDSDNQSYILSLSATPIPRSLSLIMQKYINVSILRARTRPVSIKTVCIDARNTEEIIHRLKDKEGMIYWVCPVIGENEIGLISVEQRYASLRMIYGDGVKFLHGAMHSDEQAEIYQQALAGQIKILISTTVVEVGIDIPHANIMIIEHAERFGLAQLHQLRGRVGRHGKDGTCVLLHTRYLSAKSRTRLEAMEKISNGFELAEVDMEIRGQGILFGTQQSGFNEFKYLDPVADCQILLETSQIAQNMIYEQNLDFINHFFAPESIVS